MRNTIKMVAAVAAMLLLAACDAPERDNIAVVGGTLLAANGAVLQDHCMVVVKEGKYLAVGSQAMIPLPKTSQVVDSLNHFVVASKVAAPKGMNDVVAPEVGQPALLFVLAADPRQDPQTFAKPLHIIRNQTVE